MVFTDFEIPYVNDWNTENYENGDFDGYIKIYNYGDEEVNIGGIVITDDFNNYNHYYQIPTGNNSTIYTTRIFFTTVGR